MPAYTKQYQFFSVLWDMYHIRVEESLAPTPFQRKNLRRFDVNLEWLIRQNLSAFSPPIIWRNLSLEETGSYDKVVVDLKRYLEDIASKYQIDPQTLSYSESFFPASTSNIPERLSTELILYGKNFLLVSLPGSFSARPRNPAGGLKIVGLGMSAKRLYTLATQNQSLLSGILFSELDDWMRLKRIQFQIKTQPY